MIGGGEKGAFPGAIKLGRGNQKSSRKNAQKSQDEDTLLNVCAYSTQAIHVFLHLWLVIISFSSLFCGF
jgi:hypothetical protein